jgi:RNA polymerase sigma factor FliA
VLTEAQCELILKHLPLVRLVAGKIKNRLPRQVDFNDLYSAGVDGLIGAAQLFDTTRNLKFWTYAQYRIRGAILDSLRGIDCLTRMQRRIAKEQERSGETMSLDAYLRAEAHGDKPRTLGEVLPVKLSADWRVEENARNTDAARALASAIRTLGPRYQRMLDLYYRCEMTLKQIGTLLGVNESRVSQMHSTAMWKLRVQLRKAGLTHVRDLL